MAVLESTALDREEFKRQITKCIHTIITHKNVHYERSMSNRDVQTTHAKISFTRKSCKRQNLTMNQMMLMGETNCCAKFDVCSEIRILSG